MESENKNGSGFRLSPQQQHLWLVQQGQAAPYRTQAAVIVEGPLDVGLLSEALAAVVNRHEILRTDFRLRPEVVFPTQHIGEARPSLSLSPEPYSLPAEELPAAVASLLEAQRRRADKPGRGSPLETSLFRLSKTRHLLLIGLPALCMDGAGMRHLIRELCDMYKLCARGERPGGDVVQYADLSEWLNRLLEKEGAAAESSYWRQKDYSQLFAVEVLLEHRRDAQADFAPLCADRIFPKETLEQAEGLAASYDVPLSHLLLALWEVLLWRVGGRTEFMVGVLCDGRSYAEIEQALGLLSRYLPVPCRLAEGAGVRNLVRQVAEEVGRAYDEQEYFDWRVVEDSHGGGRPALFPPYCFGFEQAAHGCSAGEVSFEVLGQYNCIGRFRLKLSLFQTDASLKAEFHYDPNYFSAGAVELLAERYQALLQSAIRHPEARIADLDILGESERRLLRSFNTAPGGHPEGACFHRLFEVQAARTPNRIAVVHEDTRLSYGELNRRANQLAHRLQKLGVGPETRVGIYMERSAGVVVALLGVSKASGAYVPLEPSPQAGRLRYMLEEAEVTVVVTDRPVDELLHHSISEVRLGLNAEVAGDESEENLTSQPLPENLSYILFTSGSTGRPKGVAVEHRQVLNYLYAIRERLGLAEGMSYAMVSTFAADLGNTVVLPSLCFGGTLHVVSAERILDRDAYAEYSSNHDIDVLKIVPSHLESLLGARDPGKVLPRKCLVLGGEASRWDMMERIRDLGASCRIYNHYGPTETTVGVSTFAVGPRLADEAPQAVPIGRPLANTEIYILDGRLGSVPLMSPGEVYLGGANLCRGYLNDPGLTAEKFNPNPFSNQPGSRLYRTGDIARFMMDGNIEFLGRADHQVKIRGYRIELGEIEAVLRQHPSVSHAVAMVREDRPGEKVIVGYVVPRVGPPPTADELRGFCREHLPPYSMPANFILVKKLPLLPNGKLDRRRLSEIRASETGSEAAVALPQTETERKIAAIWHEALQVESVGVDSNFFDIGGHSLLMVWVHSRLQQQFNTKLSVVELFKYPTIRALSDFLAGEAPTPSGAPDVKDRVQRQKEAMSRRRQLARGGKHD